MLKNFLKKFTEEFTSHVQNEDTYKLDDLLSKIELIKKLKKKIIIIGNGGSAAIASHFSIDLTKVVGIRSINFNESSLLTCFSNDFGYEQWAAKAIEFYSDPDDLVILISSSGKSKNILNAAQTCKELNLNLVTFSGFNRSVPLYQLGDINFCVQSNSYNIIESTHQFWLLSLIDYLIYEKN